jgi:hypothetical protein
MVLKGVIMFLQLLQRLIAAIIALLTAGCAIKAVPTHEMHWEPIAQEPAADADDAASEPAAPPD